MNLDTAAIDVCTPAIIDVQAPIDDCKPVEKHCRPAEGHRSPLEAFETLAIDIAPPAGCPHRFHQGMPGTQPSLAHP
ncbi:MAG: hypothetical protein L6Q65_09840 [Zoogloea sp.]|nr:hypothetical protein [Zoogloea sp.]